MNRVKRIHATIILSVTRLFAFGIPLTEKVLRTIAVCLFLLVGLRREAEHGR